MRRTKKTPRSFWDAPKSPATKTKKRGAISSSTTSKPSANAHSRRQASSSHRGCRLKLGRKCNGMPLINTASRRIIDYLVKGGIGTLCIGKNPLWKQEANMGRKNNQQFVQLPHARFIDQLTYKARLVGIQVILQEESYTSKASFLDGDPIPTYQANRSEKPVFSGTRIARSWYRAKDGT